MSIDQLLDRITELEERITELEAERDEAEEGRKSQQDANIRHSLVNQDLRNRASRTWSKNNRLREALERIAEKPCQENWVATMHEISAAKVVTCQDAAVYDPLVELCESCIAREVLEGKKE